MLSYPYALLPVIVAVGTLVLLTNAYLALIALMILGLAVLAALAEEMKAVAGQHDFSLGSVHAITHDGVLVIASATGSQLASYAWGAAKVIFVVGTQKLVPTLDAARDRIYGHSLPLEDARAYAAYGQNSRIGKMLEIHEENAGRIHVVLIRQAIGF